MKKSNIYLFVALFATMLFSFQKGMAQYTIPAKMNWWYESRFGMFVHFGSYSYLAQGEWAMSNNWSKTDWQTKVSANFDPTDFNAGTIARLAKKAGMKYLVITAKHHEGFCMWDTQIASFKDITGTKDYDLPGYTAFKTRDILMELKDSCETVGVKFCLYYSILDWNHSSQTGYNFTKMNSFEARTAYIADMKAQLKELIDRYKPAVLWFDGDWTYNSGTATLASWWTKADGIDLYNYLTGLDSTLLVNERVFRGAGLGDWECPEQTIPATPESRPWETCQTINGSWGYASWDNNYKSSQTLIQQLVRVASRDGNYLLNIGPKGDGTLTPQTFTALNGMGDWMKIYGQSIYGTTRSPFSTEPTWGLFTKKAGKLYAQVFSWPANGLLKVPSLTNTINKIYLLNDTTTLLNFKDSAGYIRIQVPVQAPNPNSSVVVVNVNGVPVASAQYIKVTGITVNGQGGLSNIPAIGSSLQMAVIVSPSNATDKTVIWTVNDTTIATISNTGLLTAKKTGTITVTATARDGSDIFGQKQILIGGSQQGANLLQNSDFETQGAWQVTQCDVNGTVNTTFGTSGTGPAGGTDKFLELKFPAAGTSSQVFVYQKIVITKGHTYKFSCTMKDVSSSLTDDWINIAWTDKKPVTGQDIKENTIATFGSWQTCNGKGFDGFIESSCATKGTYFKFPTTLTTDTVYFGINVGSWGATSNFDLYFDNLTLADSVSTTSVPPQKIKVTGITVDGSGGLNIIPTVGGTLQMSAIVLPSNATDKTVIWTLSDSAIASITNTGMVTAKKKGAVTVKATSADSSGIFGQKQILIQTDSTGTTSVPKNFKSSGFKVYPNPTNGEINIESSVFQYNKIEIIDILGKNVYTQKVMPSKLICINPGLQKGNYVLKLMNNTQTQSCKLVIY
jgi:alpha-L-fucosidase